MKVVMDAFERRFCSKSVSWNTGQSTECDTGRRIRDDEGKRGSAPFEAHDEGCGALWDHGC